ncbi:MAG: HD domain-containing phosphohydrolase [Anaerobacillus sp.]
MEKCTLHGHANLFSQQTLQLMELLRRHDPHAYAHSVQTTSYYIDFCLSHSFHSLLKPSMIQSVLLHDIGKLLVSKEILQKDGPLTLSEMNDLKRHPEFGIELLGDYHDIEIDPPIILNHHENSDGTGYPYRLNNEQLPQSVKVIRVIDSFSAMISVRPYSPKCSVKEAIQEIHSQKDRFYDPTIASLFIHYLEERFKAKKILLHYLDYVSHQK